MLAGSGLEIPVPLRPLAEESARLYPEFVHELEDESGLKVDLREQGTILISAEGRFPNGAELISSEELRSLEPALADQNQECAYLSERSVDPRTLVAAAIKAAKHRGVDVSSGTEVKALLISGDRATGVQTEKTSYAAAMVVNCAGAWA